MYPKYSDVFSEYAKIALEQGLISNAADEDSSKSDKEEKKELSNAEIMYGVKNKPTKELLEEAHPKTIVMGPSYDRFNGVVENLQQRHNVMVDIALKNPRILQTNTRYVKAQEDLINETVKLGFYLDNLHQESLMRLADACTGNLTKIATYGRDLGGNAGKAVGLLGMGRFGTIGLVAAIAGIAGLAVAQHYPQSQGIVADLENLTEEIQEAVSDYPNLAQLVQRYLENIEKAKQQIENLNNYLDGIEARYLEGENIVDEDAKRIYFQRLANKIISAQIDAKVEAQANSIISLLNTIQNAGKSIKRIMLQAPEKYEESTNEALKAIKQTFYTVVAPNVKDVANKIEMLVNSTQAYKKNLQEQLNNLKRVKESLESSPDQLSDTKPFASPIDDSVSDLPEQKPVTRPSRPGSRRTSLEPIAPEPLDADQEFIDQLKEIEDL